MTDTEKKSTRLDDEIIDLRESARIANISLSTLRRRIDAGDDPAVTRMSARRVGIRWSALRAWLRKCEGQT